MKLVRKTGKSASDVVDYGMVEQPEAVDTVESAAESVH